MAKVLDPKYEHIVGPHKCRVEDCQGHQSASSATIHRLYEEFYTSTRRVRREKRQEKAEAKIVKAVVNRKRVKGLAPRTTKTAPKVKAKTPLAEAYDVLLPKNYHYHKGTKQRGRISGASCEGCPK